MLVFDSDMNGNKDVYVMDLATRNTTQLTNAPGYDGAPAWSPDGGRIVFVSDRNGNNDLFVMNADGSNQVPLFQTDQSESRPAWSPDGKWIVFERQVSGNWDIYVLELSTMDTSRCTNDSAADVEAHFAPDTSKIIFRSDRGGDGELYTTTCYVLGEEIQITNNNSFDGFGSFSPDGSQVVFHSKRSGRLLLYVMNADGSNPVQLSPDEQWDAAPSWSPDGEQIAFGRAGDNYLDVCIFTLSTRQSFCVTDNPFSEEYPSFRPAGGLIPITIGSSSTTPTRTPTTRAGPPMVSVSVDTNCRTGSGKPYPSISWLNVGEAAEVVGRSPGGDFWIIKDIHGSGTCWLWNQYTTVTGDTSHLPVVQPPPLPMIWVEPNPVPNGDTWTLYFSNFPPGLTIQIRISKRVGDTWVNGPWHDELIESDGTIAGPYGINLGVVSDQFMWEASCNDELIASVVFIMEGP